MPCLIRFRHALAILLLAAAPLAAEPVLIADLSDPREAQRWRFVSDQVMGGVSSGQAMMSGAALTLRGTVSTANRGGFIQARREIEALPDGTKALRIRVRGNDARYFLHLRTTGTMLPWQYYQAGFDATPDWRDVTIPLSAFEPSGRLLRGTPRPGAVRSVGLVAYGRDHEAEVSLSSIWAE